MRNDYEVVKMLDDPLSSNRFEIECGPDYLHRFSDVCQQVHVSSTDNTCTLSLVETTDMATETAIEESRRRYLYELEGFPIKVTLFSKKGNPIKVIFDNYVHITDVSCYLDAGPSNSSSGAFIWEVKLTKVA